MNTTIANATEYRNLPLAMLTESKTNPRRIFEDDALKELAETIRDQGVLSPLLVRPLTEQRLRDRLRSAALSRRADGRGRHRARPHRNLTDAEVLEAQLVENLQRRDVHPMEEANGFRALLNLEEPKYSIEQIAAKTGKSSGVCGRPAEVDRACPSCGRSVLPRGDRRRPCALAGEAPARPAGTGARRLLQRGLERGRAEGQTHPAPRPQSAVLD